MYSINFTVTKEKFCLGLHYNGANSYLFVNGSEIYKFKAKDSEIVSTLLCLGNISKEWSTDMKKQDFRVMSVILFLIIMQLMLVILETFTIIW